MSKIEHEGQAELVEDFKRRQRNTLLGDSMRNGNNFRMDTFLWKGSENPLLVQRVAAWIFGCFFLMVGVFLATIVYDDRSIPAAMFCLAAFLIGIKIFSNGFKRKKNTVDKV